MLFCFYGEMMVRVFFVSLIVVFLGSLSIPFDAVYAGGDSKRNAVESTTPMESFHYDPFKARLNREFRTMDKKQQKDYYNRQYHHRGYNYGY